MESLVKEPQYPIARKINIFPFFKIFQETKSLKNVFDNYFIISNILHNRKTERYTNADLKISLYVRVHIILIPRKFCILNPENSRVIYP